MQGLDILHTATKNILFDENRSPCVELSAFVRMPILLRAEICPRYSVIVREGTKSSSPIVLLDGQVRRRPSSNASADTVSLRKTHAHVSTNANDLTSVTTYQQVYAPARARAHTHFRTHIHVHACKFIRKYEMS
eukprot:2964270-Pleurochrysis_carterae.AAC.2